MTVYKSPFPDIKLAKVGIFQFLFVNNPRIDLNGKAIIDAESGEVTTYRELIDNSLAFAHGFQNVAGLYPGSTVLIFSPNIALYPTLLFAGEAAGVTVSTANSGYTVSEFSHQLKDSGATVILVGNDLVDVARGAAKACGFSEERIFVLPGIDGNVQTRGLKSYEVLRGNKNFKPVEFEEKYLAERIAFLPYSSGTTSTPKGVEISHSNVTSCVLQVNNSSPGLFDGKNSVLGTLPLYHIYGLIVLLHQTLFNGGTLVLMPKFDIVKLCATVEKYKIDVALLVPPMALALVKAPEVDNYDMSSLRFALSGAAPLSSQLQKAVEDRLAAIKIKRGKNAWLNILEKGTKMVQGYGMSETTAVAILPDLRNLKGGTVGFLLSTVEARLVSTDTGLDVAEGEAGELWVRGPNIMVRYHNNVKSTAETITSDGWLLTGDVCVREPSGLYAIVDRSKELIKYNGFQLTPSELEGILLTCPMVADAAVIGVWEEDRATELPRAYVVVEAAHLNTKDVLLEIQKFVAALVAPHKKLRGGVFAIDVIPKSAAGKILRKDLRTLAAKEQGAAKL